MRVCVCVSLSLSLSLSFALRFCSLNPGNRMLQGMLEAISKGTPHRDPALPLQPFPYQYFEDGILESDFFFSLPLSQEFLHTFYTRDAASPAHERSWVSSAVRGSWAVVGMRILSWMQ